MTPALAQPATDSPAADVAVPNTTIDSATAARLVRSFYRFVDSGDVAGLAGLFAADATYYRPGYGTMVGPEGLARFYGRERVIRDGAHTLTSVLADGPTVGVFGEFHGTLHNGDPVDLRFADSFTLGTERLFSRRETYFSAPLV